MQDLPERLRRRTEPTSNPPAKHSAAFFRLFGLNSGSISLTFWHRYDPELFFNYANVWVTADNGATYTWLWSFTGTSQGWVPETFDLSAFSGQSIQIVFQILTDNTVTADGWYIDDVVVSVNQ